jgi:hypothetical protein
VKGKAPGFDVSFNWEGTARRFHLIPGGINSSEGRKTRVSPRWSRTVEFGTLAVIVLEAEGDALLPEDAF